MPIDVEIVTPNGLLLNRSVDAVVLPTLEGEVGILPGHIPLLTKVVRGELKLIDASRTDLIVVDNGFAEVVGNRVAVLTEGAVDIEDIDLKSIEAARDRAEKALEEARNSDIDPEEIEQLETRLQFLLAQKFAKAGKH
jgi:F-type H+-transporting ATPase subunit epsilon